MSYEQERIDKIKDDAEQSFRCRRLFSSVLLTVMDDAIRDSRKYGQSFAIRDFVSWAMSPDGVEVITNAGIEHSENVIGKMVAFIKAGELASTKAFRT